MKNKTLSFLIVSALCVSLLYIVIFAAMSHYMNLRSSEAIQEIGEMYLSGVSRRIVSRFGTTIELRLNQASALTDSVPPHEVLSTQTASENLMQIGRERGFSHLAYYSINGEFVMLYGPQIHAYDPISFRRSLLKGEEKVTGGYDDLGEDVILLGIPAAYPTEDGKYYSALVAVLPVSYISETLASDMDNEEFRYFFVWSNGRFIFHNLNVEEDSYYDRIRHHFSGSKIEAEHFINEMNTAIRENRDFISSAIIDGERRHIYCASLPYSEWHLLLSIPYGIIDASVDRLGAQWSQMAVGSCVFILFILLLIFSFYFRLAQRQMRALDAARYTAEKASRAKSEFLSNMSHDIRTPMNGIVGMTSVALSNLDNPQKVENCLMKITLSSRHLLGLINDILDMSKIESGKMTLNSDAMSLREVFEQLVNIVQPQATEKEQTFRVYLEDISVEHVYSDAVRLKQILVNLLGNAIKFTPKGGQITLTLREEHSPRGSDYIRTHFYVKDTGIGMSKEFRKNIFESFSREDNARIMKIEGAGLGMSITKFIVDAMHGTIEVESELGKGSEFHVTLDMQRVLSAQEPGEPLPDWNVLVIESDPITRRSIVNTLKLLEIRPDEASDTAQAVKLVEACHARQAEYQMILLDRSLCQTPLKALFEDLRKGGHGIPILMLLDEADDAFEHKALTAGADGFLVYPVFPSALYNELRSAAVSAAAVESVLAHTADNIDLTGRHILVAEDNDLNWEIAEELLSDFGPTLDWAENGRICRDKFRASEEGWYDAILMDIRMPEMTGIEATRAIRALPRADAKEIPIIAMSADAFEEDVRRCLDCGMDAHLSKPIDIHEVVRQLNTRMKPKPTAGDSTSDAPNAPIQKENM